MKIQPDPSKTRTQQLAQAFRMLERREKKAFSDLTTAMQNDSQAGVAIAQAKLEKTTRMMAALSNMSQSMHNLLMTLVNKLTVRS
ncbi:hypothetical protein MRY87_02670 [bacterium]|nr:hypothetical protein [bacterium]